MRFCAPSSLAFGLLLLTFIAGCKTAPSRPPLMANVVKDDVTVYQLRAIDYEYATHFAQIVSLCVTSIVASTDDPGVLNSAYQWRMWAMPQARAAAFDQDPFAGMLELWVLAGQQRHYFAEGEGGDAFGDHQGCAVESSKRLEQDIRNWAGSVMSDNQFQEIEANVDKWIDEHPIEGALFVRPSARADLAGLVPEEKQGGLQAVGNIEETFRDLNDRLTILTVQMPVEARWQAEYLVSSLFEDQVQAPADAVVRSMQEITDFLGEFEDTLSAQTLTLLQGFEEQRLAVFEAVGEEREEIVSAIEQERISILTKLDTQVLDATTKLDAVGKGLIDHFFVRLIEVLAAMGIFVFLLVGLILLVVRRRERRND